MIEAVMLWNEPNNKSHWDLQLDADWRVFAEMVNLAGAEIKRRHPGVLRVLGGISPIDPSFIQNLASRGVLDNIDVVAVHGFPLDWNHWQLEEWPDKLEQIRAVTVLPIWVTEVGASSFGSEQVQAWALERTAQLLAGQAARIHWYSLYDLPHTWEATTRHKESEGSAYYRHFHMGLLREDGTPKPALAAFRRHVPQLGLCQWFHFEDHRLDDAVVCMRRLGVRHLRSGLSWADRYRPAALEWFDRQMRALAEFELTLTFCFTPAHLGLATHHTSPPRSVMQYTTFCLEMLDRYATQLPAASRPAPRRIAAVPA